MKSMRPFSLLIKPAGADCNLRCRYCFYLGHAALYPQTTRPRMSDAVAERLVESYLAAPLENHTFAFQGGEPLLMGADFFRVFAARERRAAPQGAHIANTVQTNATLMTPELAEFFAAERWLLGVSCDGPAAIHDHFRRAADGRGSHAKVLAGLAKLDRAGADYNILTLVSRANVHEPEATYRYVRDALHCRFHQYIECVESLPDGSPAPFAVGAEEWGEFLCRLFDCWYAADTRKVSVRLFDAIIAKLALGQCVSCALAPDCRQYLVVEWNGDVYPCDFFVDPALRLGNVMTDGWEAMLESPAYEAFGRRKRRRAPACAACPYLDLCQGDCVKNRVGHSPDADPAAPSRLCAGWKRFYDHCLPRLRELAGTARAIANGEEPN